MAENRARGKKRRGKLLEQKRKDFNNLKIWRSDSYRIENLKMILNERSEE